MLREIAEEIAKEWFRDVTNSDLAVALNILSLPTGMEVVSSCPYQGFSNHWGCPDCHGTGELVRPLTLSEKLDIVDMLMEGKATLQTNGIVTAIYLPDGSRVRRGK